ncbi:MAG: hypothetical protein Q7R81_06085 [Candidatus Peregrinibacteria bacterium]|nr:hypothetical protein [Candidatus Peregrinibacteria bacterium]
MDGQASETDEVFLRAEGLSQKGQKEKAADLMSYLICSAKEQDVKDRASALFDEYSGQCPQQTRVAKRKQAPIELSPAQHGTSKQEHILSLIAKREERLKDTSIPRGAKLRHPLTEHLVRYMRITDHTLVVPEAILRVVSDLEAKVGELPAKRTQVDVHAVLKSFVDRLCQTPVGVEVFNALVSVFYASELISIERAQDLSAAPKVSYGHSRTIRQLLEGED